MPVPTSDYSCGESSTCGELKSTKGILNTTNECHFCNKIFKYKSSLRVHLQTHINKDAFPCKLCGMSYPTKTALKLHISSHSKDFSCDFCTKSFSQKSNLKTHINLVHTSITRFECDICQKR